MRGSVMKAKINANKLAKFFKVYKSKTLIFNLWKVKAKENQ